MTSAEDAETLFDLGDECSGKGARSVQAGNEAEGREWFLKAIEAYERALEATPQDDPLLALNLKLCIGARRAGLGEADRAMALYEEVASALTVRPDLETDEEVRDLWLQARLNRAEINLTADADAARAEIEDVLALAPEHPYAIHLRDRLPGAGPEEGQG